MPVLYYTSGTRHRNVSQKSTRNWPDTVLAARVRLSGVLVGLSLAQLRARRSVRSPVLLESLSAHYSVVLLALPVVLRQARGSTICRKRENPETSATRKLTRWCVTALSRHLFLTVRLCWCLDPAAKSSARWRKILRGRRR